MDKKPAAAHEDTPEIRALSKTIRSLTPAAHLLHAVKNLFLLYVLLFFAAFGLTFFKDGSKYPFVATTIKFQRDTLEAPAVAWIKSTVPTDFNSRDISKWVLYASAYLLSIFIGSAADKLSDKLIRLKRQRKTLIDASNSSAAALLRKAEALKAGKLDRSQLLEIYAETKRSLDTHKKNLAFLSIDIVDSTGMKVGEDVSSAERDFKKYKEMLQRIFAENGAQKSTWTPDGVMVCFGSAGEAIKAAQAAINSLGLFNKNVKTIKRDFRVRAGINSGELFCDDMTPMEEMTDRVIDIAGHMQKHGIVDGIAISKHSVEPLLDQFKFKDAGRVVDGCPVYEWTAALEA